VSVNASRLPEAGRWRSLFDFYVTTMRTAVVAQLQYRVTNYFYMLGMIAEPVVYLVVRAGRSTGSRPGSSRRITSSGRSSGT
jgi:hypothetical protein